MNIEYDIKELLTDIKRIDARFEKIDARFDKLDTKIDKVAEDLNGKILKLSEDANEVKINLIKTEEGVKTEIKVLSKKIDGINKRVDTQEFINRGVIVGLVLTILGGFVKIFGLT